LRGVAVETNLGVKRAGVFALGFREGVAESVARQDLAEVVTLLFLAGGLQEDVHHAQVILRDLPQGRVGGGDHLDHLGHGHIGHLGATVGLGNGDTPQAAGGKLFKFGDRQASLAVAHAGVDSEAGGQPNGDLNRFGIRADNMGRLLRMG
jgi:hypothetical protein